MFPSVLLSLHLTDYRSFTQKEITFDQRQTLILGPNGTGKTNILEAIALLSIGRILRHASKISQAVRIGAEHSRVELKAVIDDEEEYLAVNIITPGVQSHTHNSRYFRREVAKQKRNVVGVLKSVLFRPEDLELVIGGPSLKREFFNDVLSQTSGAYTHALKEYEKALKHRNKLIEDLRERNASRSDFLFWDEILIRHGDTLTRERNHFVHFLNTQVLFPVRAKIIYEKSIMSEERLHTYATAEVAAGKTLVGPHRDTWKILLELQSKEEVRDVFTYGSRGQQRLAVLWLKVGQLHFIEKQSKVSPILLLDDIFSELDEHNRELIFSLFEGRQVILTSAEELEMLPEQVKRGKIISL